MPQTNTLPFIVDRRGPNTFIVTPAMLDALQHRADARFRILAYESGDTAHGLLLMTYNDHASNAPNDRSRIQSPLAFSTARSSCDLRASFSARLRRARA